jgi:hypothetical protein
MGGGEHRPPYQAREWSRAAPHPIASSEVVKQRGQMNTP